MRRRTALVLAAPPAVFLAIFFAWPVLSILGLGIAPGGHPDVRPLVATLTRPWVPGVVLFTLGLAAASTLLTLVVGMPAAWVFARFDFPARRLLRALATVPFVLPTVVVGSAFLALLGPRGPAAPWIRLDGTIWALLLANVFYNVAVVLRLVGGLWSHIDPRTEEAARMLGATPWRAFREVTWPLLRPAILAASSIVFLFTVTSFGFVLLLGGQGQAPLEVEIYRETAILLDLPAAAALSMLQIGGIFVLLLLYARAQERLAVQQRLRAAADVARRPVTRTERALVTGILLGLGALVALPLAVLLERSLAGKDGYGPAAYQALLSTSARGGTFVPPIQAIGNSLAFALVTLVLAGALGLLVALVVGYRRGWLPRTFDALVMLPLGTSAVTVGFGFLVALRTPPLDPRSSVLLITIAHTLIALTFVVRAVTPVIRSIAPRLREVAAVLGAAPRRAWREVDGPIVARAALVGGGFAFAVSLGEFGATLFIARPDAPTIPVAIFRLLGQPGALNFAQAMAMSTILMAVVATASLAVERLRRGPETF